jgi:hypothetical protein
MHGSRHSGIMIGRTRSPNLAEPCPQLRKKHIEMIRLCSVARLKLLCKLFAQAVHLTRALGIAGTSLVKKSVANDFRRHY